MLIDVRNLIKVYGLEDSKTHALHGVSFTIDNGDFVAIMGPSGSGKSTLLHILSFLDRPSGGQYFFEGKAIEDLSDEDLARVRNKKMGFVFQSFNLLPRRSVLDNVVLPLIYANVGQRERENRARSLIKDVGLEHRIFHLSNQLSGGEGQRVAIARALVNEPTVIFADEPTGNLDSISGRQVMTLLEQLHDRGHTVVFVTHDQMIADHAKRIIRLRDGRIESDSIIK
ncbi:MAG: macrolide ABC transporter ATP-binding protein [Candidatus Terrybacteria bacterium RIFCSPLOWO2_01_FULL_44_24]|uniref:Macrolide ABC transporter ATP-binding protein n=1 Tax=Candidatus Terrybacteria bacterium RIFCSPHIGHO2_01_FULL_43_35 TaxID=1802361 RepID=A0A1G2PGJ2_9BACT|nr:MAG: macrolide ABC transporter ATP-binding protein [Candidatus Terrybacteria bacterium RIFCSPHIGHO2_01_FULL_43_35]OHA50307.1 MAG: macrolide ABC transporter ATP-binding protein [Candidatus Terrybacteria bacterium RIFCSPHIGHO2_02_FULL_43_14]OHA50939.1 MAG: macrolide ABC transporter ATP-binding protein [Candidatus Terrybacteria bacterium RIFCSPLOWO2_01_FULL_44_24]